MNASRSAHALVAASPLLLSILAFTLPSCGGDDDGPRGDAGSGGATASGGSVGVSGGPAAGAGGGAPGEFVAGGARPVTVTLPEGYDPARPAPLLLALHGFGLDAAQVGRLLGLGSVAKTRGIIYAAPEGTADALMNRFWNATDACCDLFGSGVDDVAYLLGLLDEIASKASVDLKRVYVAGHSNGGFMAYRLACDASDRIAAIVSVAGAMPLDEGACEAGGPVSVLQVHGTADAVVPYNGGALGNGKQVPSADDSVAPWAGRAGCGAEPTAGAPLDLESSLAGAETRVDAYGGCADGVDVALWSVQGGPHEPSLSPEAPGRVVDFLLAHSKP
jgi:polyhydroxybutyrate depolymerase